MGNLVKSFDKFIRKATGVQGQIDAVNANTKAQVEATERASKAQEQAALQAAKAAADQQSMLEARKKVETEVATMAATPIEAADVQLQVSPNGGESTIRTARKRRAQFGKANTGVVIP